MRRRLAQMRNADRVRKCLLFGVDRTYRGHHETDAFDPKRTCRPGLFDHLVGTGDDGRRDGEAERASMQTPSSIGAHESTAPEYLIEHLGRRLVERCHLRAD